MKKLLVATALVTLPFGALAADLPKRAAAPAPAPMMVAAHNWTGFYLGAQAGFGKTYAETPVYCRWYSGSCTQDLDKRSKSQPLLGGHFGYNQQIGSLVFGVEADANVRFGSSDSVYMTSGSDTYLTPGIHLNSDASIRARAGVLVTPKMLVYVTGGLAFGHFKAKGAENISFDLRGWESGWTIGAGVQYALDSNWSVRAEYRYTDYGTHRGCAVFGVDPECGSVKLNDHKVTVGVSYRFGGKSAPVVARY